MKTKYFFLVLLAVIMFQSCDSESEPVQINSKLEHRVFTSQALTNNYIRNSDFRYMQIYTPAGYNSNGNIYYPVIYLLHGLPFSEYAFSNKEIWNKWIDPNGVFKNFPDFPQEGFQEWIDGLILSKKIDPIIIVIPNAVCKFGFSFYSNSALNGNFEDYIAKDLVNYIDNNYKTINNKDARAVIGFSQGGYGAIKLGMKHADKFSVIASHSAPLVFEAFKSYIPMIIAENPEGIKGPPDPSKFLTYAYYAMGAAWSPNINNQNIIIEPFSYSVDLPFATPSGEVIDHVWAKWLENDPFTMLDTYGNDFKSLNGIYFDCGKLDEFGWGVPYEFFIQKLDAYGITYTNELHDYGHFDKMFSRLEISLSFCSDKMK